MPQVPAQYQTKVPAHILAYVQGLPSLASARALSANTGSPFGVLSIKGKVWSVRKDGLTEQLLNENGDPLPSIQVVVLGALPELSKTYYATGFVEGVDQPPDCASLRGVVPDAGVPKKQSETCGSCPHNVWGSKITPGGSKTKACQDVRRIAVMFTYELALPPEQRRYGALLLRVPPASLKNLAEYGRKFEEMGIPPETARTKVGFDPKVAHQQLVFTAIGFLSDQELPVALETAGSLEAQRILEMDPEPAETAAANAVKASQAAQGGAPLPSQPAPAPQPVQQPTQQRRARTTTVPNQPAPTAQQQAAAIIANAQANKPAAPLPQQQAAQAPQQAQDTNDGGELLGLFEEATAQQAPVANGGDAPGGLGDDMWADLRAEVAAS